MDKHYSPQDLEQKWYKTWESAGYFSPGKQKSAYCIMLPPPNITGSLHMGHGFQHTLMDILTRYHRMQNKATLWQPGTDHAGISTQMVVERQLEQKGLSRQHFDREAFVQEIWKWKEKSGSEITQQLRRMGSSVDWTRERFTMDEGLSAAVQKVFIQLYQEGLIYRGQRLVNWDPKLRTAISDLEVIQEEEQTSLWYIKYPGLDTQETLTIATTRPETLLGDVAVAVHPEDLRHKHWIGKKLRLPLCDRIIPVIGSETIDPNFGSGAVKITPAHDFNDYAIGKKHHLEPINIFNDDATLNQNVPEPYQKLPRFEARKRVLADLSALGLIEKEVPHRTQIPRGEKSQEIIEPYLTCQWFLKVAPLAGPAIHAVQKGEIRFIPEHWTKIYYQWMDQIEDWCISRQLWWGHRIPAFYDQEGQVYVGYTEEDVRFKHKLPASTLLTQDHDVLDTWFSAALWPFSSLGWPEKTDAFKKFYPTNVLVTGFDIIFFWVARMIMMSLKFTNTVPFRDVYITGLIRDAYGKKMSKSKGNVLDPIDLIDGITLPALIEKRTAHLMLGSALEKIIQTTKQEFPEGIAAFGTDPLRFTFCALASPGRYIHFDLNRVAGYRNFCNKLWNASRFVVQNFQNERADWEDGAFQYSIADLWILSRLQKAIAATHKHLEHYRFDLLAHTLYDFVWHEYCDWYLELSKSILHNPSALEAIKRGTRKTLVQVLETILRLVHPVIPFITEEIWQKIATIAAEEGPSLMLKSYPTVDESWVNEKIEKEIALLQAVTLAIRTVRSETHIPPSQKIRVLLNKGNKEDRICLKKLNAYLSTLAKLESATFLSPEETVPPSASTLAGNIEILIPLADLIDKEKEITRLTKEINKTTEAFEQVKLKLESSEFQTKAPLLVVEKEKERARTLEAALTHLRAQREKWQIEG